MRFSSAARPRSTELLGLRHGARGGAELEACLVVKDASGQKIGYFYFEEEPGRRSEAKLLTKDEARRVAADTVRSFSE
jgi:hypothetical protein